MRASKALQQQQQMGKRAATKHIFGTADALFLREQVPVGSQFRSVMMARPLPPTASESCTPPAMVATSMSHQMVQCQQQCRSVHIAIRQFTCVEMFTSYH